MKLKTNLPPEGGWGYIVCVGVTIVFIICFSHFQSMGMIYKDFLDNIGEGDQGFTIVTGVMTATMSTTGILTNMLMKRFSLRQVGWLGAILITLSWLLNIWVYSIVQLSITVGVIQALGTGILMAIALTSFNQYFNRRRVSLMALCNLVTGLANMAAPLILTTSMEVLGFKSTMLIMSSVTAHGILAVTLMHPVEWHQKEIQTDNESQENVKLVEGKGNKKIIEGVTKVFPVDTNQYSELILVNTKNEENALSKSETNTTLSSQINKSSCWNTTLEMFDFDIFKDPILWNMCIGTSIADITDVIFFMLLPLDMLKNNFTMNETAWCMSIVAGADLISRGVVGLLGYFTNISSRTIYFTGICFTCVFRIIFCFVDGYFLICLVAGALGFLRAFMVVHMSIIFAEYIPDKFTAAFGMNALIMGIFGCIMFPVAGYLSDSSGSFLLPYSVLNILLLIMCIIPWGVEFIITKNGKNHSSKKVIL